MGSSRVLRRSRRGKGAPPPVSGVETGKIGVFIGTSILGQDQGSPVKHTLPVGTRDRRRGPETDPDPYDLTPRSGSHRWGPGTKPVLRHSHVEEGPGREPYPTHPPSPQGQHPPRPGGPSRRHHQFPGLPRVEVSTPGTPPKDGVGPSGGAQDRPLRFPPEKSRRGHRPDTGSSDRTGGDG